MPGVTKPSLDRLGSVASLGGRRVSTLARPVAVALTLPSLALLALLAVLAILAAAILTAPPAGASNVPTTGLTVVNAVSHGPNGAADSVFERTAKKLSSFAGQLRRDDIGRHLPGTGPGSCTGYTHYTVELTYKTGPKLLLLAYDCKGAISGNLTGNVKAFVRHLATLVP